MHTSSIHCNPVLGANLLGEMLHSRTLYKTKPKYNQDGKKLISLSPGYYVDISISVSVAI